MVEKSEKKGIDAILRKPLTAGIIIGFLAALVQALLFPAGGPVAYGFCVACHTRDLIDVTFNNIFGTSLFAAPIALAGALPVLTIIGVLIGAATAALTYREFRLKKGNAKSYVKHALGGFFFMVCALLMGACPYRIALRIGYGDLIAIFGLIAIIVGVFIGVKIALKKMEAE
ncbi:MAG TPA: YeeE/YedE thiosulfate transporter family protein [Methanocorpusculum sp.]|nr:YeeE/YedE thiosulfate transporter family protein [Methanocorpusculum sp.]HJJ50024.1 YeeE/YedE thiosulfate transporter family protein [Methanocorpusculum sp.]HJJ54434.1 YeeE/YedE thiosulfate transporter family protein [Methanocorpusculum sp.]